MNLKDFFYRQYYQYQAVIDNREMSINLKKFENRDQRERVEKHNAPIFRLANEELTKFTLEEAAVNEVFSWQLDQDSINPPIQLATTYPGLFIGSGYTHETGSEGELKLGFFFDHTSGLPVLPGSSIKGVLRSVFPQFKTSGENKLSFSAPEAESVVRNKCTYLAGLFGIENSPQLIHRLELSIFEGVDILKTERGQIGEDADSERKTQYRIPKERDIFLDAFVSDSYNPGNKILGTDALTPHGENPLKNPIPLPFLKVLPGVVFTFTFRLNDSPLSETVTVTADQKKQAFKALLLQFGVGAKTNVGYGQFLEPEDYRQQFRNQNPERRGQNPPRNTPPRQLNQPGGRGANPQGGNRQPARQEERTPGRSAGPSNPPSPPTPPTPPTPSLLPAAPKAKSLSKWKPGEPGIIGTVQRQEGGKVVFKPENIEGFEGLLISDNVRPNALADFKPGLRFNLKLVSLKANQSGFLSVHVHSFKPLE